MKGDMRYDLLVKYRKTIWGDYKIDLSLVHFDEELIEVLLDEITNLRDKISRLGEIDDLKGQLAENEDYRERCREADIKVALLEGDVIDLKNEVFDLNMEISDLRDEIYNK